MIFLEILLIDTNIINSTWYMKSIPNNEEFCFLWNLQNLPKFYNKSNMEDHWSVLQTKVCALIL